MISAANTDSLRVVLPLTSVLNTGECSLNFVCFSFVCCLCPAELHYRPRHTWPCSVLFIAYFIFNNNIFIYLKAFLNTCVLSLDLKTGSESTFLTSGGSEFQSSGAGRLSPLLPMVAKQVEGTVR